MINVWKTVSTALQNFFLLCKRRLSSADVGWGSESGSTGHLFNSRKVFWINNETQIKCLSHIFWRHPCKHLDAHLNNWIKDVTNSQHQYVQLSVVISLLKLWLLPTRMCAKANLKETFLMHSLVLQGSRQCSELTNLFTCVKEDYHSSCLA